MILGSYNMILGSYKMILGSYKMILGSYSFRGENTQKLRLKSADVFFENG